MLPEIADTTETGSLGVRHLKRFWSKQRAVQAPGADWVADNTLLCGVGLGVRETLQYLLENQPSFEAFEAWIRAKRGPEVDASLVARLNLALSEWGLTGEPADPAAEPALTPADLACWEENGYVILHNAVPPENCTAAIDAICGFFGADLTRPETWYFGEQGHSIWIPLLHHPALWANRNSPRIHRAFAQLWEREDLWGTVDQAGFNPPETGDWKFPGPYIHWDVSLARPIPFGLQGILYLVDTAADQGAFTCVPGFHLRIDSWLGNLPPGTDPRAHDFSAEAIPIAGKAGDLVIWHHALPHGSSPNRAKLPRIVQYYFKRPSHWGHQQEWV